MSRPGSVTKTEKILLGLTAAFLCLLVGLCWKDTRAEAPVTIRTELSVPKEDLTPDFSPLDINTATAADLETLPGIGPELAARIVAWREEHGSFETTEDIMNVDGIGEGRFKDLNGWITVEETT